MSSAEGTEFSRTLQLAMSNVGTNAAQLAHEYRKLSGAGACNDETIRRWATGTRRPQNAGRVGHLERALQALAEKAGRSPLKEGTLLEAWRMTRSGDGADDPAGDHAATSIASDVEDQTDGVRRDEELGGVGLRHVCAALLRDSTQREDFVTPLPRIPVPYDGIHVVLEVSGEVERMTLAAEDARDAVSRFLVAETDLLVVLGVFGAGKSEALRELVATALEGSTAQPVLISFAELADPLRSVPATQAVSQVLKHVSAVASAEFEHLLMTEPRSLVLLLDGYDEANVPSDTSSLIPSPPWLADLLSARVRVVVGARESSAVDLTSFVALIRRAFAQLHGLKRVSFEVITLGPCRHDAVLASVGSLPPAKARTMRRYLEADEKLQMEGARRPLFLKMVADMDLGARGRDNPISLVQLYELYTKTLLDRDFKKGTSKIAGNLKDAILQQVAHLMFEHQIAKGSARAVLDQIEELVVRHASDIVAVTAETTTTAMRRAAYSDFAQSNHLLVPGGVGAAVRATTREFVHHTLYEFFLAQYLATRLATTGQFGLPDDRRALRAFDSLLPYFLRALLGDSYVEDLRTMVAAPSASDSDRMIGLFLLEDTEYITDLLNSTSEDYIAFLRSIESFGDSFFIVKMARFQLILREGSLGHAYWYVHDIRVREVKEHVDIESHTFGDQPNPTDFLLQRLANARLAAAAPIFVYRLGQRGDENAIETLESYQGESDPFMDALAAEAVQRIRDRAV